VAENGEWHAFAAKRCRHVRNRNATCSHACGVRACLPSRRIVTARIEWMAAADALQPAPAASYGPVLFHRLNEVGTTSRLEAAMAANEWAQGPLIDARGGNKQHAWQLPDGLGKSIHCRCHWDYSIACGAAIAGGAAIARDCRRGRLRRASARLQFSLQSKCQRPQRIHQLRQLRRRCRPSYAHKIDRGQFMLA
jgi:predicted alpha-1,6-mannanase (GH76 family)